jgi:heme A synthase
MITEIAIRAENRTGEILSATRQRVERARDADASRVDQAAWLILIPIAIVIALGLMTAWFLYCQQRGAWPAMDMPSFSEGGTWKVYCAK